MQFACNWDGNLVQGGLYGLFFIRNEDRVDMIARITPGAQGTFHLLIRRLCVRAALGVQPKTAPGGAVICLDWHVVRKGVFAQLCTPKLIP